MKQITIAIILSAICWAQPQLLPLKPGRNTPETVKKARFLSFSDFDMKQSYTASYVSTPNGSQSSGLYISTLSYHLGPTLTLSADIGFRNIFYIQKQSNLLQNQGLQDPSAPDLLFPSIRLEYTPSEHFTLSLQFVHLEDLQKTQLYPSFFNHSNSTFLNN